MTQASDSTLFIDKAGLGPTPVQMILSYTSPLSVKLSAML